MYPPKVGCLKPLPPFTRRSLSDAQRPKNLVSPPHPQFTAMLRTNTLWKLLFIFVLVSHFVACSYWTFAKYQEPEGEEGEWLPAPRYVDLEDPSFKEQMEQYGQSIYWTLMVLLGNDTTPSNPSQTAFTTVVLLFGILVFASIIGSASALLSNLDAAAEQKKEQVSY